VECSDGAAGGSVGSVAVLSQRVECNEGAIEEFPLCGGGSTYRINEI
jgi:exopolysaccharide biosynthesis protein